MPGKMLDHWNINELEADSCRMEKFMKILSQVRLENQEIERLKAVVPDLEVVAAHSADDMLKEIIDSDIFFGRIPQPVFLAAERLRWVQVMGAGVETCIFPELVQSDVILTNTSGAFNHAMADHAFALILAISRGIAQCVRDQSQRVWRRSRTFRQLAGQTLGIIGLGNIGCEVARRGKAFGMKVIALDVRSMECPAFVDQLWGIKDMDRVLKQSDYLVIAAPLTPETRGMMGAAEMRKMKPTAHLINIGRGPIVDEAALIDALKNAVIAGAGLDVFEKEPLPPDSEIWDMENVIISPHMGGAAPETRALSFEIFLENFRKFVAEEPLRNVVDKHHGY
jgi:phosphoglycerate dehydrogenase-like enzyme